MDSVVEQETKETAAWCDIRLTGSEVVTYLQSQLSCDVADRSPYGLLLTPSGEVVTDVDCRYEDDAITLTVRTEVAELAKVRLQRFLLRSDVEIQVLPAAICPYETVGEQIALGRPGPKEFERGLAPQAFGPTFVADRVSFTKGCFTGQELVGRLDARGANIPFRLARLSGPDVVEAAAVIASNGPSDERGRQGITTAVTTPDGFTALALVHRSLLLEPSEALSSITLL